MSEFKNSSFEILARDIINDGFYVEGKSNRGTMGFIRQYSELIIRKLLNISHKQYLTLGDLKIKKMLDKKTKNSRGKRILFNAIKVIRPLGNDCLHTQRIDEISKQELDMAFSKLFELYSYLFIFYFEEYRFGNDDEIVGAFSILPPIIRYITLSNLYEHDKDNPVIIDRLALATLKAKSKEDAIEWIEKNKEKLYSTSFLTQEAHEDNIRVFGERDAEIIRENTPDMYTYCYNKIMAVSDHINSNGKTYETFEEAKPIYLEKGKVSGDSIEIQKFNSIMEFVYLGRKLEINDRNSTQKNTTIINVKILNNVTKRLPEK